MEYMPNTNAYSLERNSENILFPSLTSPPLDCLFMHSLILVTSFSFSSLAYMLAGIVQQLPSLHIYSVRHTKRDLLCVFWYSLTT